MANYVQPEVFINYISQRKKICVNRNNMPSQLLIQTDYYLNETYNFQIINAINQIVEFDNETTYEVYGSYQDAKKTMHILFYTPNFVIKDNILSFTINTFTSEYLAYVKSSRTPIDISIVAKKGNSSYLILRDKALANPRAYLEGQAPTDIVYQNVFNANIPVTGSFGAGNGLNLAQDYQGQEIASFAFGDTLTTSNDNQFVIGYNNTPDATKAFIVANSGNIFTVDYEGNIEAGDLNVGAISATSITVSGEDLNQVIDDKVEYLSTAFDDKLEATSGWVNSTFETSANAAAAYNALEQDISDLSTAADGKFELKTDATEKFETLTGQTNYLSGQIDATNLVVNQITNTLDSKADKSALDELSGQVQAIPVVTKVSDLEQDIPYLSSITSADIPTGYATEQWVLDKHYITSAEAPSTVYTAGFGLKLDDGEFSLTGTVLSGSEHISIEDNIVSLVGDVGKTYTGASGIVVDNENDIIGISATNLVTTEELGEELNAYTKTTDLADYISSNILTSYATTGWVEEQGFATTGALSAASGTLLTSINGLDDDIDYLSSVITGKANQTALDELSGATSSLPNRVETLETAGYITSSDLNGYATTGDLQYVSGVVSAQAEDITVLKGVSGTVDYSTVFDMLSSGDTDTLVISKDDQNEKIVFTAAGGGGGGGTQLYHGTANGGIDVNNVEYTISISANYLSANALEGYAEQSWVEQNFLTGTTTIPTKTSDLQNDSGFLTDIPTSYAQLSDIPSNSDISGIASAVTTGVVTKEYVNALGIDGTTYTAGTGLGLDQTGGKHEFYLTAQIPDGESISGVASAVVEELSTTIRSGLATTSEIPTTVAELTDAGNYAKVADLTAYIEKSASGQFATSGELEALTQTVNGKADSNNVYTKAEIQDISGNLHNEITGAVSGMATEEWVEGHFLSSLTSADIPEEFVTATELATALEPYAISTDVTAAIETATTGKADLAYVNSTFLSTSQIDNYYTKDEVNTAIADFITEDDLSGLDNRLTAIEADYVTSSDIANFVQTSTLESISATLTGQINDLTTGTVATNTTNIGLLDGRVQTIENDYTTSAYVTGQVNDLATGAVATNTTNIGTVSGKVDTNTENISTISGDVGTISTAVDDLSQRIPSTVSQLINDVGFITTGHLSSYVTEEYVNEVSANIVTSDIVAATTDMATQTWVGDQNYQNATQVENTITSYLTTNNYVTSSNIETALADYAQLSDIPTGNAQLTNTANYITISQVPTYTAGDGIKIDDYQISVTGGVGKEYSAGEGLALSGEGLSTFVLTATIPSSVSELTNDVGFITSADVPGAVEYTAGTGIEISNENVISMTAQIPTVPTYVGGTGISITSTGINEYTISAAIPTVATLSADMYEAVSGDIEDQITNKGYITGITVSYNDEEWTEYTLSGKGISFTDDIYFEASESNDIVNVVWKGVKFAGGSESIDQFSKRMDWSNEFTVEDDEGDVIISLANPIPTNSDISGIASAVTTGIVTVDYITGTLGIVDTDTTYTVGQGLAMSGENNEIYLTATIPTVPTNVGDFNNDAGYVTSSVLEDNYLTSYYNKTEIDTATGALALSAISGQIDDMITGKGYVTTDTTYTAGTGLKLTGTEFSLSAAGAGENKVLSSANGTIVWADNVAGGGGGGSYTAGTGIDITNGVISNTIDDTADLTNGAGYITANDITNKQRINPVNGDVIDYDPAYEVFKTTYSGGDVVLSAVTDLSGQLGQNQVATFEEWITFSNAVTSLDVDSTINLIGDLPSSFDETKTHVFVRRLVDNNGTVTQYVSYAYYF